MTSADLPGNRDNFCYRHPDRQSFVLCQRCLRTICGECQIPASVGVICPECLRDQQRAATAGQRRAERRWRRRPAASATAVLGGTPLATYWIIGVTVAVYLLQYVPGLNVEQWLAFNSAYLQPQLGVFEPWRMLTVLLVHASWLHIGLNMLALWMIGRILEPLLGRGRFLVLYLLSGLGASLGVTFLAPHTWVVGASGAIFGLFGALLIIGRHIGANVTEIAVIIAINFAFPFVIGLLSGSLASVQISWQAHLGGLIAGGLVGLIYARTRTKARRPLQLGMLVAFAAVLLVLAAVPALTA